MTERDERHVYFQRTKMVRSGQYRIYYAAGCKCGWRTEQFRVTDERAVTDWLAHADAASSAEKEL